MCLCRRELNKLLQDLDQLIHVIVIEALRRGHRPPFIVLGPVNYRRPGTFTLSGRHKIDLSKYNADVDMYNALLNEKACTNPHLFGFWDHRDVGRAQRATKFFHPNDGVHLGPRGDEKPYKSLSHAAVHQVDYLGGKCFTY